MIPTLYIIVEVFSLHSTCGQRLIKQWSINLTKNEDLMSPVWSNKNRSYIYYYRLLYIWSRLLLVFINFCNIISSTNAEIIILCDAQNFLAPRSTRLHCSTGHYSWGNCSVMLMIVVHNIAKRRIIFFYHSTLTRDSKRWYGFSFPKLSDKKNILFWMIEKNEWQSQKKNIEVQQPIFIKLYCERQEKIIILVAES